MTSSTLIKGGRIITAADDYVGDVYVDGERIAMLGESLDVDADRVIDASGKYVLPGCVDPSRISTCRSAERPRSTTSPRGRRRPSATLVRFPPAS